MATKEGLKAWERYVTSIKGQTEKSKTLGELKYIGEKKQKPTAVYVFFSKLKGTVLWSVVLYLIALFSAVYFIKLVLPHLQIVIQERWRWLLFAISH